MSIISDGEILARIHKFKMFRKEGNLFIDVYEALLGKPASKFIAVPNLIIQEADKKYFGFGDSKTDALKDCLKKIKDVPIHAIVHLDKDSEKDASYAEPLLQTKRHSRIDNKKKIVEPYRPLGKIYGTVVDHPRPNGFVNEIIEARGKDRKGLPVKNATVTVVCKGLGKKKTRTDNSGYYEFTGLADGVWTIKMKAKGYEAEEAKVEISSGGEYEENFA